MAGLPNNLQLSCMNALTCFVLAIGVREASQAAAAARVFRRVGVGHQIVMMACSLTYCIVRSTWR
jgi:hypothetical protein